MSNSPPRRRRDGLPVGEHVPGLDEAVDAGAGKVREGPGEVLVHALSASFGRGAVLSRVGRCHVGTGYQIFDFTCAFERRTMSLMARSKKFIFVKISWLTRLL